MAIEVLMPKLGLTMTEGTIGSWLKAEGDVIKKGDILFSVETDKLTNDIEADADGILLKILCPAGETAACKSVIAYIGQNGEAVKEENAAMPDGLTPMKKVEQADTPALRSASVNQPADGFVRATPYARKLAMEQGKPLANIIGSGEDGVIFGRDVEAYENGPKIKLSPMAAKLADELGVDVASLEHINRIMKADILEAAGQGTAAAAITEPDVNVMQTKQPAQIESISSLEDEVIKVSPLRKSIASNMSMSWSTSPRVTYTRPVDATMMKQMRERLKKKMEKAGVKLTYNHILMYVISRALIEFPDINASFRDNMLIRHKHVNLGLAVAKGDGLIVPNLKNCEMLSLKEIAVGTEKMIEKARSGKLTLDEMTGGTFTISSLGPYGITSFSPIINQPELAILGVCDMIEMPVVVDGKIEIRCMMNLCLTADHRVIDGVMAASFLKRVAELLEDPYVLFML